MDNVNCLRCPLAALLPSTDMSARVPRIYCGAWGGARTMLFEGCESAQERNLKPDRVASEVEIAYLRAMYPAGVNVSRLAERTGRTVAGMKALCNRRQIMRRQAGRSGLRTRLDRGLIYTPQQRAYILAAYHNSARWPAKGRFRVPERVQEQEARRTAILRDLVVLGCRTSWPILCQKASAWVIAERRCKAP